MNKCKEKNKYGATSRGFSLIEVLVSITILLIGVVAVFLLMANNIKKLHTSKDQIVATMLAQEGIELVRNLKENNNLGSTYDNPTGATAHCGTVGPSSTVFTNNCSTTDPRLYIYSDELFRHNSLGSPTKFYREVFLQVVSGTKATNDREIAVRTFVTWNGKGFIDELASVDLTHAGGCTVANECLFVDSIMLDQEN